MVNGADPCGEGLTEECFKERPEHAKQILAHRLMEMLVGAKYMKRLQKFKGLPLPDRIAAEMGTPASAFVPPGLFSILPPFLPAIWESGPAHIIQAEEGELILGTKRRADIDFNTGALNVIVAAVPGKKICMTNYAFTVAGEVNLTWKSAGDAISGAMDFGAEDEPRGATHHLGGDSVDTVGGEALNLLSVGDVQVSGFITYVLEDA
jgi:hypothetical protein